MHDLLFHFNNYDLPDSGLLFRPPCICENIRKSFCCAMVVGCATSAERRGGISTVNNSDGVRQLLRLRLLLQDNDPRVRAQCPSLDSVPTGPAQLCRPPSNKPATDYRRSRPGPQRA